MDHQSSTYFPGTDLLSFTVVDATAEEASESFSQHLGAQVAFVPHAEGTISLDLSEVPERELVDFLAAQGAIAILKEPAPASATGEPNGISLQARGIDADGLARLLGLTFETPMGFRASAPGEVYNLDISGATPEELVGYLSRFGQLDLGNPNP